MEYASNQKKNKLKRDRNPDTISVLDIISKAKSPAFQSLKNKAHNLKKVNKSQNI